MRFLHGCFDVPGIGSRLRSDAGQPRRDPRQGRGLRRGAQDRPAVLLGGGSHPTCSRSPVRCRSRPITPRAAARDSPASRCRNTPTTRPPADLRARIARTIDFVRSFEPSDIDGSEDRGIDHRRRPRAALQGSAVPRELRAPRLLFPRHRPTTSSATAACRSVSATSWARCDAQGLRERIGPQARPRPPRFRSPPGGERHRGPLRAHRTRPPFCCCTAGRSSG